MDPAQGHDLAAQSTCTTCEFTEDLSKCPAKKAESIGAQICSQFHQATTGPQSYTSKQRMAPSSAYPSEPSKAWKVQTAAWYAILSLLFKPLPPNSTPLGRILYDRRSLQHCPGHKSHSLQAWLPHANRRRKLSVTRRSEQFPPTNLHLHAKRRYARARDAGVSKTTVSNWHHD